MIDDQEFDMVSQNAHMLFGAIAVLGPAALFPAQAYLAHFVGFGLITLWAAVKEFWWDYRYETAEVRGSSFRDFCFYEIGGVLALCGFAILVRL